MGLVKPGQENPALTRLNAWIVCGASVSKRCAIGGSSVPVRQRIASAIWDNLAHVPGALLLMLASAAVLVWTFRPGRPAGA
jgi:hypothetical protein